jgi:hypothetical protein
MGERNLNSRVARKAAARGDPILDERPSGRFAHQKDSKEEPLPRGAVEPPELLTRGTATGALALTANTPFDVCRYWRWRISREACPAVISTTGLVFVIMPMLPIIAFVVRTAPLRLLIDRIPAGVVAISILSTEGARRSRGSDEEREAGNGGSH